MKVLKGNYHSCERISEDFNYVLSNRSMKSRSGERNIIKAKRIYTSEILMLQYTLRESVLN